MSNRFPLNALAAHAAGDFPLQSDWMAEQKLDSPLARAVHVAVYTASFLPVVRSANWSRRQSIAFLAMIASTHFVIDSRRWNDDVPVWFDQALHLIALALAVAVADSN